MNFYIGDTHFFHKNIVGAGKNFDKRPYHTLQEMHEDMKNKWNSVVTNADHVYITGDYSWKITDEAIEFIESLNGNKHLIIGNHDSIHNVKVKKLFEEIVCYKEMKDTVDGKEYKLVLSHYPIMMWNGQHRGTIHLYGHVHNSHDHELYNRFLSELNEYYKDRDKEKFNPFYAYNVGCMHWNYTPVTLGTIINCNKLMSIENNLPDNHYSIKNKLIVGDK